MPRYIRLDISPATATHCGIGGVSPYHRCGNVDKWGKCNAFGRETLGIDEDDEMSSVGHDVLTLPLKEAMQRFNREWDEHLLKCEKGGDR